MKYNDIPVIVADNDDDIIMCEGSDKVIIIWPSEVQSFNCKLTEEDKTYLMLKYL